MAIEPVLTPREFVGTQSDFNAITDLTKYHVGDIFSVYDTSTDKFVKYYRFAGGDWRET